MIEKMKEERRQKTQERYDKQKKLREDHHKRDIESQAMVKKLLSERKKCLFTRLEKSFVDQYETPELQEKKK